MRLTTYRKVGEYLMYRLPREVEYHEFIFANHTLEMGEKSSKRLPLE